MNLRTDLIKLAYQKIDLRPVILPLVTNKIASSGPEQVALYQRTTRLAHSYPDLRSDLLPVLKDAAIRGAKEEAKGKEKKEEGFFSKVKKVFRGESEVEQLKDDLPQKGRKMDTKEAEAFANHLTERVIKDISGGVGKAVGKKFHKDEYEPDADDYKWFLERHADKIEVPSALDAFDDRQFAKIAPWFSQRDAADAGVKVAYFFKYLREVRKTIFTGGFYGAGKGIAAVLGGIAKKVAGQVTKNPKARKVLEKQGNHLSDNLITVRKLSDNYKKSLEKLEKLGERPSYWSEYKKRIWPALKNFSLPHRPFIEDKLDQWDNEEKDNEYRNAVLASFFKETLKKENQSERAREKRTNEILTYHKEEIANFVRDQIKKVLEGKDTANPDTIQADSAFNMNNVLSEVKKNILTQMPEVRKQVDTTFEGQEDARKSILGQMDNAATAKRITSFLIPDVSGAIKGSKIKTIAQDKWLGIIPRQFGPKVDTFIRGFAKKPGDLEKKKKKDVKEKAQKAEKGRKDFFESHERDTVKKPSTGRYVTYWTLARSKDPQDKSLFQKELASWQQKKKKTALYRDVVRLAFQVPETRGDLIPILLDNPTPHIPAIPQGLIEMNKRIDDAIDSGTPDGFTTMRYGGPFRRRRRRQRQQESDGGKEREGFGVILPPPKAPPALPKAPTIR